MATQAERRAGTRRTLLDAAADVLVRHGAAGFTTAAVTTAAGVSNGALFRHFPTRLDLTAATVEHVLARLRDDYDQTFAGLASPASTVEAASSPDVVTVLDLLWAAMADREFGAVLELYTQSRTDDELLAAIHPIVSEHGDFVRDLVDRVSATLAGHDPEATARVATLGNLAILTMQGLVVGQMAGASAGFERDVVATYTDLIQEALIR